jgi:hypothetical protein
MSRLRRVPWLGCGLFALVTCVTAAGILALVGFPDSSSSAAAVRHTPTAEEFAQDFVRTANAYSAAHASDAMLANPDCVEASPGHYMCSYAVRRRGRAEECHLMQARWTPEGPSTITVTLAGRAARCESLRAALDSLQ